MVDKPKPVTNENPTNGKISSSQPKKILLTVTIRSLKGCKAGVVGATSSKAFRQAHCYTDVARADFTTPRLRQSRHRVRM